MLDKFSRSKGFWELHADDKDLTMFTITNLSLILEKDDNLVYMSLKLKRKVVTELITTFLPTILLLLITFTTVYFDKDLFGDAIAVNLTIMLVMTTIFTSKIEELPPTSDMKMIDVWLISCLVIPFLEVILRTTIECLNCSCDICVGEGGKKIKEKESNAVRAKVAPQKVQIIQVLLVQMKHATVLLHIVPGFVKRPRERELHSIKSTRQGRNTGGVRRKLLKRNLETLL